MDFTFLDNRLAVALIAAIIGAILSLVVQRILNKRGIFTYFVQHYQIGESTDDAVFGTIQVTWNERPVSNLYLSTIELKNESLKDYEDVVVKVFTNDTYLWTEKTEIVGTTQYLRWTAEFAAELSVEQGKQPTETQWDLYRRERKYIVPVMNRGQVVLLGLVFLSVVIYFVETSWIAAVMCLVYGLVAMVPGAGLIKASRRLRAFLVLSAPEY